MATLETSLGSLVACLYVVHDILAENPGGDVAHMSVQDGMGGRPWSIPNPKLSSLHPPLSTIWNDAMATLETSLGSLVACLYVVHDMLAENPGGGVAHMSVQDGMGGRPWSIPNPKLSSLHPPLSTIWNDAMATLETSLIGGVC
jgi:hypothetical protein